MLIMSCTGLWCHRIPRKRLELPKEHSLMILKKGSAPSKISWLYFQNKRHHYWDVVSLPLFLPLRCCHTAETVWEHKGNICPGPWHIAAMTCWQTCCCMTACVAGMSQVPKHLFPSCSPTMLPTCFHNMTVPSVGDLPRPQVSLLLFSWHNCCLWVFLLLSFFSSSGVQWSLKQFWDL